MNLGLFLLGVLAWAGVIALAIGMVIVIIAGSFCVNQIAARIEIRTDTIPDLLFVVHIDVIIHDDDQLQ